MTSVQQAPAYVFPSTALHDDQVLRSRPTTSTGVSMNSYQQPTVHTRNWQNNPHQAQQMAAPYNVASGQTDAYPSHIFGRPHTSTSAFPTHREASLDAPRLLQPLSTIIEAGQNMNRQASPPPREVMMQSPNHVYGNQQHSRNGFASSFATPSVSRPATAPVAKMPTDMASIIPPRRILPFDLSNRPTSKHADSRPTSRAHGLHDQQAVQGIPEHNTTSRPETANSVYQPRPYSAQGGMQQQDVLRSHDGSFKRPLSSRSPNVPTQSLFLQLHTHAGSLTIPHTIEDSLTADTLSHANLSGLAGHSEYTSAGQEETLKETGGVKKRRMMMTDMICRYLKDDNFMKLAEEVEGEWRRVLGGY